MSKELECLKRIDTKNYLTEREHREFYSVVESALKRLEAIDNANPSEAFMKLNTLLDRANHDEILSRKSIEFCEKWIKETQEAYDTIKQALLKAQEPKQYLKWEDLEFKEEEQTMKVLLNGSCYLLNYYTRSEEEFVFIKSTGTTIFNLLGECSDDKQLFNDLHLERVEE